MMRIRLRRPVQKRRAKRSYGCMSPRRTRSDPISSGGGAIPRPFYACTGSSEILCHLAHQRASGRRPLLRAAPGDLVAGDLIEHQPQRQMVHLEPGQPRLRAAVVQPRGAYAGPGPAFPFGTVSTSRSASPATVEKMALTASPSVTSIRSAGAQGSGSGTPMPLAEA